MVDATLADSEKQLCKQKQNFHFSLFSTSIQQQAFVDVFFQILTQFNTFIASFYTKKSFSCIFHKCSKTVEEIHYTKKGKIATSNLLKMMSFIQNISKNYISYTSSNKSYQRDYSYVSLSTLKKRQKLIVFNFVIDRNLDNSINLRTQ